VQDKFKKNKNVVFISVTSEAVAKKAKTLAFLKRTGITWKVAIASSNPNDYGIQGFPTTFVIGKDGKIAWHDEMGGTTKDAIAAALK